MFKKATAKRLPFFQSAGRHVQPRPLQEERPSPEPESRTPEEALDAALAALEDLLPPEPPEEAVPAAAPLGQEDFDGGMAAYEAGDYESALALLQAAGTLGHGEAQFFCGEIYRRGVGLDADSRQALLWYKRAAKQGHCRAQLACARLYEEGLSMNLKQALFWYEQAAKQGDRDAQLRCGCMYFRGRAETRNPKKARYWLEAAAEGGSQEARQLLEAYF